MSDDATTPQAIEQAGPKALRIRWRDGSACEYDVVMLRRACRCALCVDEWTGQQILAPEDVADDVRPVRVEPTGRYAIQIDWSDGHTSGIYTFEYLRQLSSSNEAGGQSEQ